MTPIADVVTFAVLGFMGVRLVTGLRTSRTTSGHARWCSTSCVGIRWRHVWPVPLVLHRRGGRGQRADEVPGLSWGWWSDARRRRQPGVRLVRQPPSAPCGSGSSRWCSCACCCRRCRCSPTPRSACSAPAPRAGRGGGGRSRWCSSAWCTRIIGIPIGAALALSLGGAYFMAAYLRACRTAPLAARVPRSSPPRAHTVVQRAHRGAWCVIVVDDRRLRREARSVAFTPCRSRRPPFRAATATPIARRAAAAPAAAGRRAPTAWCRPRWAPTASTARRPPAPT